jgi:protein ImuA
MHEVTGGARRAFALALAGQMAGAVLWITETRETATLCPQGIAGLMDPGRLILARPAGRLAVLQVMEEALRSGAAALVVAELDRAADLTQSRRLQLAAGTGGGIGLCLVPAHALATNAAESRWRAEPLPEPSDAAQQRWTLEKTRRARPGFWDITPGAMALPAAGGTRHHGAGPVPQSARRHSAAAGAA